ncbi:PilZ domain-containing protein [Sphingobium sufflavum]|uniref:PilZ domain-containing protein n=1 Tax=Sphingobium sufflavum TaxID=1129547 RepID=UPI001F3D7BEE|nr:PilZ domain-containing protein [Sphingobium sufflavum]MCE7798753.1 PilZ domain-containing protein [Sphingobium sufflavum]
MTRTSHQSAPLASGSLHHSSRLLARQAVLVGVYLSCPRPVGLNGAQVAGRQEEDAVWHASSVTDMSRVGCGLRGAGTLLPGMAIRIMFPGFEGRPATVMWAREGAAGCAFATPLPAAILDYILRMSDPAARG